MKIPKQQYTLKFKQQAVKRIQGGEDYELVANELEMSSQTPTILGKSFSWRQAYWCRHQNGDSWANGALKKRQEIAISKTTKNKNIDQAKKR